jgi:two-component system response regulator RegA
VPDVLIVEDDPVYGPALVRALQRLEDGPYVPTLQSSVEAALADSGTYDGAIVDLKLPDGSGVDVVRHLSERGTAVLVLTGHGSIPAAVQCMQEGAVDFLTKPVSTAEVGASLSRALTEGPRSASASPPSERLDDVERAHILSVLDDCGGNISEAARRLGLYRRTLQRKLQKL